MSEPLPGGEVVNQFYRGQRVEITATEGEWSRVSGLEFDPRWMLTSELSRERPADLEQPPLAAELDDPRMVGIPKVGEYGHTEADVLALRMAASELLRSGQCSTIEDANKSVNVSGVYYVKTAPSLTIASFACVTDGPVSVVIALNDAQGNSHFSALVAHLAALETRLIANQLPSLDATDSRIRR